MLASLKRAVLPIYAASTARTSRFVTFHLKLTMYRPLNGPLDCCPRLEVALALTLRLSLILEECRRRRLFHRCAAKTTNSSGGQPTLRMAVVSVWSLEEDTLKATFT